MKHKKLKLSLKRIHYSASGTFKVGKIYKVKAVSKYPDGFTFLDVYNEFGELSIVDTYMINKLFVWVD